MAFCVCSARDNDGWQLDAKRLPTPSTPDSDPESGLNRRIWILDSGFALIRGPLPVHRRRALRPAKAGPADVRHLVRLAAGGGSRDRLDAPGDQAEFAP